MSIKNLTLLAAVLKWVPVGSTNWNDTTSCYTTVKTKDGDYFGVISPDLAGTWYFYILTPHDEAAVASWSKGKTKLMSLTKNCGKTERKVYKASATLDTVKDAAGKYLQEYLG